jgi:hypothetical protein
MEAVQTAADSILSDRVTPVFTISSVTGQGVDLLRAFVARVRRSPLRYSSLQMDSDPDVCYDRWVKYICVPYRGWVKYTCVQRQVLYLSTCAISKHLLLCLCLLTTLQSDTNRTLYNRILPNLILYNRFLLMLRQDAQHTLPHRR